MSNSPTKLANFRSSSRLCTQQR